MPTPIEAYRQGHEKGRSDTAGGRLAETTMGMLRDDPSGHFQNGYSDGAAAKPFSPPPSPPVQQSVPKGLIPKFSDNPFGWFIGIAIVVEVWVLWQLVKAPFLLTGCLIRREKPSPLVIAKTVVAGLAIGLAWWVHASNAISDSTYNASSITLQQRLIGEWNCEAKNVQPGFAPARFIATLKANGTEHVVGMSGEADGRWALNGNRLEGDLVYGGANVSFSGGQLILEGKELTFACTKK